MAGDFENDENLDVLQNLEFVVVAVARDVPSADDYDVMSALDAIIKDFRDLERGREPKRHSLQGAPQAIFQAVLEICEWRMGKKSGPEALRLTDGADFSDPAPLSAATLSRCLKKIRKSVDRWHSIGGSRGYLEFVAKYFPPGSDD